MNDEEQTTTMIFRKDVERLETIKEHPRVPNAEVINRLIDFYLRYEKVVKEIW